MRKKTKKLAVQSLESRDLMAADLLPNGELLIETGNGNDNIEIHVETSYSFAQVNTGKLGRWGSSFVSVPLLTSEVVYTNRSGRTITEQARFDADDVTQIRVRANGGHDIVTNNTRLRSYIYGGSGNDVLNGGSNVDYIYGSYGNDTIRGKAGSDRLYGQSNNDVLEGGSGTDYLYGSSGNDTIRGGGGGDRIYGSSGNDNLYGQTGNDYIYGGSGDDGLFGGSGVDFLQGSSGDDRFLVNSESGFWGPSIEDNIDDQTSNDARIRFEDGTGRRFNFSGGNWTEFDDGAFSDSEIETIDLALMELHHKTNNTNFLKTNGGLFGSGDLVFERLGARIGGNFNAAGVNSSGKIILVDPSFDTDGDGDLLESSADEDWLLQVVYHEIAHNFDNENSRWNEWKDISGWRSSFFWFWEDSSNYTTSTDGDWAYENGSRFARNYGRFNPNEDFATYFAKTMMEDTGRNFADGGQGQNSNAKADFMDQFFAEMA